MGSMTGSRRAVASVPCRTSSPTWTVRSRGWQRSSRPCPTISLTRRGALPQFGDEPLTEVDLFGHLHDEHLPSIRAWLETRPATAPSHERRFRPRAAGRAPADPHVAYGVPAEGGTMIGWSESVERLRSAEAYWLATTAADGSPHVVPVWGVMVDDELYLETGAPNTAKATHLAANPAATVHLDGINDALIVHGQAVPCRPDPGLGEALAAAFGAKYKDYSPRPTDWDDAGLHRFVPRVMLAWRDMPTATRWRFPAG